MLERVGQVFFLFEVVVKLDWGSIFHIEKHGRQSTFHVYRSC